MERVADNERGRNPLAAAQGSLDETPLPTLLVSMAERGDTGLVRIEAVGELWLHTGRLYLAMSSSSPELGAVLFDCRLGSTEDIGGALQSRTHDSGSALDVLLDQHPESTDRVQRLLHEYNLNALFEMLVPGSAVYRIESDLTHPLGPRFAEETVTLIDKAKQRMDIWRRIAVRIPSTGAVFRLAGALPAQVDERMVSADEWRFLSRLNGNNTVADVINQTGESAFRVCSSLYRLLLENVIEEAQAI